MIRSLQVIAIVLLLALGAGSTYAILNPSEAKTALRRLVHEPMQFAQVSSQPPATATPVKMPPSGAGKPSTSKSTPAPKTDNEKLVTPAPLPDGAHRPPTRQEMEAKRKAEEKRGGQSSTNIRRATYIGPAEEAITTDPPPAELYPFTVARRVFPTPEVIRVELTIKNASGGFWGTAYIALRSTGTTKPVVFRIDDWGIDEVVGLDYTFPKAEVGDRLKGLRVARVTGIKRESALSQIVSEFREQSAGGTPDTPTHTGAPATGEVASLKVPGLLGLMTSARGSSIGAHVEVTSAGEAARETLAITLPAALVLPNTMTTTIVTDSVDRTKAMELLNAGYGEALDAQKCLASLAQALGAKPYAQAMSDTGTKLIEEVRTHLDNFNKKGVELGLLSARASDFKVKEAERELANTGDKIIKLINEVERQVRKQDPKFEILKAK